MLHTKYESCVTLSSEDFHPTVLNSDNHCCPYFIQGIGDQDEDDVHVILEYDKNEVWGNITTPRANR